MYVVLRFISIILIVMALMFLGADFITSLEKGGTLSARSLETVWALFNKSSEVAFTAWLHHAMPGALGRWVSAFLSLPAWSVPGVLGVVLAILFGRHVAEEA